MPVIEVRRPGDDEQDLPAQTVGAVAAGALHQLPDLTKTGQGEVYIGCLVTNASATIVTLKDAAGRAFPVQAGQPGDCDFEPGVNWLGLIPTAAINAGEVVLIPRVRRPRHA